MRADERRSRRDDGRALVHARRLSVYPSTHASFASPPPANRTAQPSSAFSKECRRALPLLADDVNAELARRQQGYGRGRRMQIEKDADRVPLRRARRRDARLADRDADPQSRLEELAGDHGSRAGRADADGRRRPRAPQARRHARAPRPRRPHRHSQVRSRRRARHPRARVGARDDGARRRGGRSASVFSTSSACASAATSCTSAASTRCVRRQCRDDINAAADASPLRTLDADAEQRMIALHRRDQARGQHARRHLRGRRRRTARRARLARLVGPQARRTHRRGDHVDSGGEGRRDRHGLSRRRASRAPRCTTRSSWRPGARAPATFAARPIAPAASRAA